MPGNPAMDDKIHGDQTTEVWSTILHFIQGFQPFVRPKSGRKADLMIELLNLCWIYQYIYIYLSTAKLRFNEFINQTWTRPPCMNQFWKPNSVIWRFSGANCWTAQSSSRYCLLSWWPRGQSTHGRGGFVTLGKYEAWNSPCKSM